MLYALIVMYYTESFYENADVIMVSESQHKLQGLADRQWLPELYALNKEEAGWIVVPLPQDEQINMVELVSRYTGFFRKD